MDKQKLEEAKQLAMSMTSHPVAFGVIEHTERACELLSELAHALDQKHAEYEDLKACAANNARNLARKAQLDGMRELCEAHDAAIEALKERLK